MAKKTYKEIAKQFLTKKGELTMAAVDALPDLTRIARGEAVKMFYWNRGKGHMTLSGSGRFQRSTAILRAFQITWTMKNDSPRRGQEHNYIHVDGRNAYKIRRAIQALRNANKIDQPQKNA